MDKQTTGSESGGTLVEGVMATIRQRIAARSLTPGAQLPSIRAFAKSMR
ncbi:GntR family transcriptional regulator, partial [Mesorhizobium sp. M7A.F.Ca.CA.002.15.2.1]